MLIAINFLYLSNGNINQKIDGAAQLLELQKYSFRFAILGLGGGLFSKFLYDKFPKVSTFYVAVIIKRILLKIKV